MTPVGSRPVRIANCSGFFGDRLAAAREMVDGGPIDVLTGDWLAELTMLILAKNKARGRPGFAGTFVRQMGDVLADCVARGIRVVSNAGGLDPSACAEAVAALGTGARIAHIEGDDILDRIEGLDLVNMDTGEKLTDLGVRPLTANAYLGGWGIAQALEEGADVVITGRVTDASLVVGPAAWWHRWKPSDWDALAGAVVAGHVIECGAQCTGGNFSFFQSVPGLEHAGFPLVEVAGDGAAIVTKHAGTGGAVTVDTVTAQLLYEIEGPRYLNPDVTARFDTITLTQESNDRVRISDVRGEPPPEDLKVGVNYDGGFRNSVTLCFAGLDLDAKADLALRSLWRSIDRDSFDEVHESLSGPGLTAVDPASNDAAVARLTVTVMSRNEQLVGRSFSDAVVQLGLGTPPGMFGTGPPSGARAFGVYWPTLVSRDLVDEIIHLEGKRHRVAISPPAGGHTPVAASPTGASEQSDAATIRLPLGRVCGARSGDKGGNANIGVWARSDEVGEWMSWYLTPERVRQLLPEAQDLPVAVHLLPNLRAVNIVITGLLGRGVAASSRADAQAKSLGEWLRARVVDVPEHLIGSAPALR